MQTRIATLTLAGSLLLLGACDDGAAPLDAGPPTGDAGPPGATDAGPPGADAGPAEILALVFDGVYFVPERTDVSTYPVDEVEWTVAGNEVVLAYNLPKMLVGQSTRVAFRGPVSADGTTATLTSADGTANCDLNPDRSPISCLEMFTNLEVDLTRVREIAQEDDPAREEQRVAVSARFSTEPIGVVETDRLLVGPVAVGPCATDADCGTGRCDIELPGQGLCEPDLGDLPVGSPCTVRFECANDLECDHDNGTSTCQPHGGG